MAFYDAQTMAENFFSGDFCAGIFVSRKRRNGKKKETRESLKSDEDSCHPANAGEMRNFSRKNGFYFICAGGENGAGKKSHITAAAEQQWGVEKDLDYNRTPPPPPHLGVHTTHLLSSPEEKKSGH